MRSKVDSGAGCGAEGSPLRGFEGGKAIRSAQGQRHASHILHRYNLISYPSFREPESRTTAGADMQRLCAP